MKNFSMIILATCAIVLSACTVQTAIIPYTEAHNYFVRNDAKDVPSKITSQEQLEQYFGMAAFMGKNGEPTKIDFSKEYVIAVVLPVTDLQTELKAGELKQLGDTLVFHYQMKQGEKQTFTIRPMLMIIVSNDYQGAVKLAAESD